MSKPTPAPWVLFSSRPAYSGTLYEIDDPYRHLTDAERDTSKIPDEVDAANRRLIAAAPDLLSALKAALDTAEFERHPFRPWHDEARAAIAKVEGEA